MASATDEALTVSTSSVQFATTFEAFCSLVTFDVQDTDVRCTLNGDTPTASSGHKLYAGKDYTWSKTTAQNAKFISATGSTAIIHVSQMTATVD